jgi:hypothetical protein
VGKVVAAIVAGRLRDPRAAGLLALAMLLVGIAIGRRRR